MKLLIDSLSNITGWTVTSPTTIKTVPYSKYISGLNTSAIMINFSATDSVRTATKTFGTPFDVTNYNTLVFSIWSQNYGLEKQYIKPADFVYKIDINGTNEFYVPAYPYMTDVNIGIEAITSISQIKITAIHTEQDMIAISNMLVETEEIPFDILIATKEHIDNFIDEAYPNGILIGTVTAGVGDTEITISNPNYLDRYGVIKIDGGGNSEIHQVDDNDGNDFQLNSNFDGATILNAYTGANVYLQFPSYINPGQFEIRLPGISIWGVDPEPILRGSKLETLRSTFTDTTSKERQEGQILEYTISVDCESRSQELIALMSKYVRMFIAREVLWINGRRHRIYFSEKPVEFKPTEGIDYIPKVQYKFYVEVTENIYDRSEVPVTQTINVDVDVQQE